MKKVKVFDLNIILIVFLFFWNGCSKKSDYNWETFPPKGAVSYPLSENGICLNYDLDSLTASLIPFPPDDIFLVDLNNRTPLFFWNLLSGILESEKIDSKEYVFWVTAYFPKKEDRNTKSFLRIAKFKLKLNETTYEFGLDKAFKPEMEANIILLDSLLATPKDSSCFSEDWEVAADCAELIEELEYYLLGAIVNGHTQYLSYFQKFRADYPSVNIGEWSENLAGNERTLMSMGLLEYEDHLLEHLKFWFEEILDQEKCH